MPGRGSGNKGGRTGGRPRPSRRTVALLAAAALAVGLLVVGLAAGGGGDGDGDDDQRSLDSSSSSTTQPAGGTTATTPDGSPTSATTAGPGGTSVTTATTATTRPGGTPSAPWRARPLARSAVPAEFVEAWRQAKNRSSCALLVPSEPGGGVESPTASTLNVSDGWSIQWLTPGRQAFIDILGAFQKNAPGGSRAEAIHERTWRDGSVARYGPNPSYEGDPAFEGVLTLPDQDCKYIVWSALGQAHLEFVFDHLRFVEGAGG